MSSGFVSGGTTDAPIERDDKWLAVQMEIEKERQERKDREKAASEGKSLFETLEANKAAKQEAFEEANRLKNQFRALDDDEIEFLNEIRGRELAEEARVRQETKEGLDIFRKHREEMEKKEREKETQHDVVEKLKEDEWKIDRKRKAGKEKVGGLGIKLRKTSTAGSRNAESVNDTGIPERKCSRNGQKPKKEADSSLLGNGEAKSDDETSTRRESKDQSICAGNLRENSLTETQSTIKSVAALVSYGSDEDDEW